ncbi:hypothetical protein BCT70_011270 [Vibrio lentus]|uniref:TRAFAC clade GTPase domain-containing protein n=1 Tax=Vibrio TaxID=662 RepID=UPI000C820C17|nr:MULTISPECIES: hypothetical protein [Vibrio]MCB5461758.1 hypothetical protein [Vibrio lentus]MCC4849325.1 hypothetical protein [Vibrio lentus]MCC5532141.1 hypothetical protein [Vibrio lentus]MCC5535424.1 hypothetical protein [Vibrio lentus]MCC5567946.1 hypothetical protein [Vibrio lentus]
MSSPNILIFGGPNSGKTHFAGQLVGRLKHKSTKFKVRRGNGESADIAALTQVLTCLEEGNSADHTPTNQYGQIHIPLVDSNGNHVDINWPDYGGEQISNLFKQREVPKEWQQRIEHSEGWILFIRLSSETTFPDALEQLTTSPRHDEAIEEKRPDIWDANAYYIELVQILCHVGRIFLNSSNQKPTLSIALSCFDELKIDDMTPEQVLQKYLPLFTSFINNIWPSDKLSVWGVSPLGKPLKSDSNDEDFVDEGPETQGWVIPPNQNRKDSDLSLPLSWILDSL